jgi:hypothetical protein
MWWQSSRLDRIEANIKRINTQMDRVDRNIDRLAEISEATNRRIDRFVDATAQQIEGLNARTDELQRAVEYRLTQDR